MGQESGRQRVVFDSVQFLYNEVNPIYPGVVTTTDAFDDLEFINCTFKGNDFSTQEVRLLLSNHTFLSPRVPSEELRYRNLSRLNVEDGGHLLPGQ